MNFADRIEKTIKDAYEKGQTAVYADVGTEVPQEEIDAVITNLHSRDFSVSYHSTFGRMSISLPIEALAKRVRRIAYDTDEVSRRYITRMTKDIVTRSERGGISTDQTFLNLADKDVVTRVENHFKSEGFNVTRTVDSDGDATLEVNWA